MIKKTLKKFIEIPIESMRRKKFFSHQKNVYGISKSQIKKSIQMGFTPEEYVVYDLEHNNPKEYISEFERYRFRITAKDYRIMLDNKIIFYQLVHDFAPMNTIYAYKRSNKYVTLKTGYEKENILSKLQETNMIVYKKTSIGGGEGFHLLSYLDGHYHINRNIATDQEISNLLSTDDYLLEEYCEQSEFENNIWPYSVNTIRLITVLQDKKVKAVNACHRIGVDKFKCVDNAHAGSLHTLIDLSTGELSVAHSRAKDLLKDKNGEDILFSNHPITKAQIQGAIIPNWNDIVNDVVQLHTNLLFTNIPFIAWDIALTDDGYKIIEANTSSGLLMFQIFGGLRNKELGLWMKENGYIKQHQTFRMFDR